MSDNSDNESKPKAKRRKRFRRVEDDSDSNQEKNEDPQEEKPPSPPGETEQKTTTNENNNNNNTTTNNTKTHLVSNTLAEKLKKIFKIEESKYEYNKQEIPEYLKYHSDDSESSEVSGLRKSILTRKEESKNKKEAIDSGEVGGNNKNLEHGNNSDCENNNRVSNFRKNSIRKSTINSKNNNTNNNSNNAFSGSSKNKAGTNSNKNNEEKNIINNKEEDTKVSEFNPRMNVGTRSAKKKGKNIFNNEENNNNNQNNDDDVEKNKDESIEEDKNNNKEKKSEEKKENIINNKINEKETSKRRKNFIEKNIENTGINTNNNLKQNEEDTDNNNKNNNKNINSNIKNKNESQNDPSPQPQEEEAEEEDNPKTKLEKERSAKLLRLKLLMEKKNNSPIPPPEKNQIPPPKEKQEKKEEQDEKEKKDEQEEEPAQPEVTEKKPNAVRDILEKLKAKNKEKEDIARREKEAERESKMAKEKEQKEKEAAEKEAERIRLREKRLEERKMIREKRRKMEEEERLKKEEKEKQEEEERKRKLIEDEEKRKKERIERRKRIEEEKKKRQQEEEEEREKERIKKEREKERKEEEERIRIAEEEKEKERIKKEEEDKEKEKERIKKEEKEKREESYNTSSSKSNKNIEITYPGKRSGSGSRGVRNRYKDNNNNTNNNNIISNNNQKISNNNNNNSNNYIPTKKKYRDEEDEDDYYQKEKNPIEKNSNLNNNNNNNSNNINKYNNNSSKNLARSVINTGKLNKEEEQRRKQLEKDLEAEINKNDLSDDFEKEIEKQISDGYTIKSGLGNSVSNINDYEKKNNIKDIPTRKTEFPNLNSKNNKINNNSAYKKPSGIPNKMGGIYRPKKPASSMMRGRSQGKGGGISTNLMNVIGNGSKNLNQESTYGSSNMINKVTPLGNDFDFMNTNNNNNNINNKRGMAYTKKRSNESNFVNLNKSFGDYGRNNFENGSSFCNGINGINSIEVNVGNGLNSSFDNFLNNRSLYDDINNSNIINNSNNYGYGNISNNNNNINYNSRNTSNISNGYYNRTAKKLQNSSINTNTYKNNMNLNNNNNRLGTMNFYCPTPSNNANFNSNTLLSNSILYEPILSSSNINNEIQNSSYNFGYNSPLNNYPSTTQSSSNKYNNNIKKSSSINIEDLMVLNEKFREIINALNNNKIMYNECFEFWNYYYNCSLYGTLEKLFTNASDSSNVQISINYILMSVMICYDCSFEIDIINNVYSLLQDILRINHNNLMYIYEHILSKISSESRNNDWVLKLKILVQNAKNSLDYLNLTNENFSNYSLVDKIIYGTEVIIQNIRVLLKNSKTPRVEHLTSLFKKITEKNYSEINEFFRQYILRVDNMNGSVLASVFLKENANFKTEPAPYLRTKNRKPYSLILDLDETLVHFKVNPNNETEGVLKVRPGVMDFLGSIDKYYELIVFTAATQEYADLLIDAIEENKIYFEHRLYRQHTVIIDNDFVKDLTRIGRPMDKIAIVDNMPQNFRLQKENGINIKAFWGEDIYDTALIDLGNILVNIALEGGDIRDGLAKYRDEIVEKVTSNISKQNN